MADLPLHGRPSQTVLTLGLGAGRTIVLAIAFPITAVLGELSSWPAGLAFAAVLRLMLLVALTRAAFRCAALCLTVLRCLDRSRVRSEILREDSPI